MKNISKSFFQAVLFSVTLFSASTYAAISTSIPQCVVYTGNVVSVWQTQDTVSGSLGIQGASGSFTLPGFLNITDLTIVGTTQSSLPSLFSNSLGDCVAVWQYVDILGNSQVAAAILPHSTSIWIPPVTISTTLGEVAGFDDQVASIDVSGNVLVAWTSFDGIVTRVRAATYSIPTLSGWTTSIDLSQN